jgi:hypothetical protein
VLEFTDSPADRAPASTPSNEGCGSLGRVMVGHVDLGKVGNVSITTTTAVDALPDGPSTQPPVPTWATRLAHTIPLFVLPSGLWRLAVAFGFPMGQLNDSGHPWVARGWPAVYIAAVSLLSEAVALTAFGLVRPLGEEVPHWVPFVGGRGIRPKAVIMAATLGSVALMLIWTLGFWDVWAGNWNYSRSTPGATPFWGTVFTICYAPLNLWGPALLMVTWAYRRRVTASTSARS